MKERESDQQRDIKSDNPNLIVRCDDRKQETQIFQLLQI